MKKILLSLGLLLPLVACSGPTHKIGSTVEGKRLSVMDNEHSVKADPSASMPKIMLPNPTINTDWPQVGYNGTHLPPNAALSDHPVEIWRADIGRGSDSQNKLLATPVVSDHRVFTMDAEGDVSAFDTETGHRTWRIETTPEDSDGVAMGGGLAVVDDTLYVTTGFGEVLALKVGDGSVRWRRSLFKPLRAAPTVEEGRVYVVTIDNELHALDVRSGESLWSHNGIVESATLMGASSPATQGDSVVVAYSSGEIFDLRAESGRVSWDYGLTTSMQVGALPAIADIRGLPVLEGGRVYAISHNGRMAAIDRRSGDRAWEADLGGINTPVFVGSVLYVLENDNQLIALAKETGRVLWVRTLQKLEEPEDTKSDPVFWTGPVLANGLLWFGNSLGHVVAVSPDDGSEAETINVEDPVLLPPVVANKTLYVVTDHGDLVALR